MANPANINQVAPVSNQIQMTDRALNPNQMLQAMPKFTFKQMIESFKGFHIKQKFEPLEVITGCLTKNRYYVYEKGADGSGIGNRMLKCSEGSGCFARRCCAPDCRRFYMKCTNLFNDNKVCLEMTRDCACSIYCLNRAVMKVYYTEEGSQVYLGKVTDLFSFTNFVFQIDDEDNKPVYTVKASMFQCAICLYGCPGEACRPVRFELWKGNGESKISGNLLKRTKRACCKVPTTDAEKFTVPFEEGASFKHKALLLAACLLIDNRVFEEGNKNNEVM